MDLSGTIDLQLVDQKNKTPTLLLRLSFSVFQACAGSVEFQTLHMIYFLLSLSEVTKVLFPAVILVNHHLCFPDLHGMDGILVLLSTVYGELMSKAPSCNIFENKAERTLLSSFPHSLFFFPSLSPTPCFFILMFVSSLHTNCLCMTFLIAADM